METDKKYEYLTSFETELLENFNETALTEYEKVEDGVLDIINSIRKTFDVSHQLDSYLGDIERLFSMNFSSYKDNLERALECALDDYYDYIETLNTRDYDDLFEKIIKEPQLLRLIFVNKEKFEDIDKLSKL